MVYVHSSCKWFLYKVHVTSHLLHYHFVVKVNLIRIFIYGIKISYRMNEIELFLVATWGGTKMAELMNVRVFCRGSMHFASKLWLLPFYVL